MDIDFLEAELLKLAEIEEPIDRAISWAAVSGALAAQSAHGSAKELDRDFVGAEDRAKRLKELIIQTEEIRQWCCLAEHFEPTESAADAVDTGYALMTKLVGLARLAVEITHKSEELKRAQPAGAAHLALAGVTQLSLAVRQLAESGEDQVLLASTRSKLASLEHESANLIVLTNDRTKRILEPPEMVLS